MAISQMKTSCLYILLFSILFSCSLKDTYEDQKPAVAVLIPDKVFGFDEVFYSKRESLWRHIADSSRVSGLIVHHYPDSTMSRKIAVFEGKREGVSLTFFADGGLRISETYANNRLHGEVKRWSQKNGYVQVALLQYQEGRLHGEQKKWYDTGELHKVLNMNHGKENGMQKAYRKNGALYANYQALNGRSFGMKRSNLCVELNDEKIAKRE